MALTTDSQYLDRVRKSLNATKVGAIADCSVQIPYRRKPRASHGPALKVSYPVTSVTHLKALPCRIRLGDDYLE